jgi:hypothetical protein
MVNLSEFTENLKSDRDTQITVALIVFFMLAFPVYFNFASNNASSGGALGTVGNYKVSGEYTFIELDSGTEGIADGDTLTLNLHSDAVQTQIADKNLVAVIVNMTYDEDETSGGGPPSVLACSLPGANDNAPDTISATVSRGNDTASGSGQNPGSHAVTAEWYDSSIIDTVVSGLSESEIMDMLEGGETGIGNYTIEISVVAESGGGAGCPHNDGGEEVNYTVSLVLLDYNIIPDIATEV